VVLRRKLKVLLMPVMVLMVAATLFGAHEALADVFTGTSGDDYLIGTASSDTLSGLEGNDYLEGRAGDDYLDAGVGVTNTIKGGRGNDRIYTHEVYPLPEGGNYVYAGAGNDLIYAREETASYDRIDCGSGFDQVETIHREDVTLSNCERALGPRRGEIPE
jgi:Ca2+-binding RTX toxin-like protein